MRAAKALQYALKSEAVRADLIALARDMGYNLRIEKKKAKGEKKPKYRFIFSRLEIPQESDRLRAILQRLGIEPDWEGDWDGEAAPPTEPLPQNGHAPTPEVHPPTGAPKYRPRPKAPGGCGGRHSHSAPARTGAYGGPKPPGGCGGSSAPREADGHSRTIGAIPQAHTPHP
jgi:hypothetical protein